MDRLRRIDVRVLICYNKYVIKEIFTRDEGNPILKPADWPYRVNSVFNPGAVEFNGETFLLVRVEDMKGFSHLAVAKSRDGRQDWRIDTEHLLCPDENIGEERFGLEDSRVVWLPERNEYAITYVSFSRG
ncbi:MAG: glycosidase, partial [Candidatus Marinimicrobia bacterium]|nr:glycosidase [Candidatus Neomarinimicrobiota bacterium]